jgi:hypothetical protein
METKMNFFDHLFEQYLAKILITINPLSPKLFLNRVNFHTIRCSTLTDEECEQCSELFSNHYGTWGINDKRYGRKVRLSPSHYQNLRSEDDHFIAMAN